MDPKARRFMWSVINRIATQEKLASVVLTSHAMEEVEALCGESEQGTPCEVGMHVVHANTERRSG
jgi:ABC-type Na+ transport system ATPase subunit NatA